MKKTVKVQVLWKNASRTIGQVSAGKAGPIGWIGAVKPSALHPRGGWCAHFSYLQAVSVQAEVRDFADAVEWLYASWILSYRVEVKIEEETGMGY